ncbi:hypothetical protein ACFL5I_02035 [Planctomycetota bacterium]
MKPIAVVDIGTNSLKMVIARVEQGGKISVMTEKAIITRIGRGVIQTGRLARQGMDDTIQVLQMFQKEVQPYGGDKIFLVATEAVRKARNRKAFVQMVRKKIGLEVEVLSPKKEALFSYQGVISEINVKRKANIIVTDIGGGSTELIQGKDCEPRLCRSLPLGAVSLTEKFIHSDPVKNEEYLKLKGFVESKVLFLKKGRFSQQPKYLIGVGGTVVTLAAMILVVDGVKRLSGRQLTLRWIEQVLARLKTSTLVTRREMIGLAPGRADIILAGALILVVLMKSLGVTEIMVSTRGMRYGYLLAQV